MILKRWLSNPLPTRLFLAVVCGVCLGLLGNAALTYTTLLRLRIQYLSNRGNEIAAAIESQARGPGRRNNPQFWQSLFDEKYPAYSESATFLALVDARGGILARTGKLPPGLPGSHAGEIGDTFVFDFPLAPPRGPHGGMGPLIAGWRLRVGVETSRAAFIRHQANVQLGIAVLAVAALAVLSLYLVRTLDKFLDLKAREGAEAHLKALGTMAASLAHEIRNPLGAMKGLTQLAQEEMAPDDSAQERLRTVVSEAERLERLVSDLLDFARPVSLQPQKFDLGQLATDVKAMLQPRFESSEVTVQLSVTPNPLSVETDPGGLKQVLLNVLMNAVDASPKGGAILLKAGRIEGDGGAFIEVDDSGPGLGPVNSDDLFQPFMTTKARGTGLGLAISKRIMDSLGGTLTLANLPGGGARCSIRLPAPP